MNVSTRFIILSLTAVLVPSSFLGADGGAVRLSERQGGYLITVFTSPTPLRAGPFDLSVLVQDAGKREMVADATIDVNLAPRGKPSKARRYSATTDGATNKLFYAALCELSEPGWWNVEIAIEGPRGSARVGMELEAAEPLPRWLNVWPWFCWPALVVVLFGVHQVLARWLAKPP